MLSWSSDVYTALQLILHVFFPPTSILFSSSSYSSTSSFSSCWCCFVITPGRTRGTARRAGKQ
ncbi:hypothetical protein E2C01_020986 [Portunus trituberculatus]|uniref:Uncharacterized protein n=1 Tax=Portunus trituberculatus TaxID=210409 RepID=A0A5B7E1C4_PORTR|nr:hypothetical protein [Portunus trituberculatus]